MADAEKKKKRIAVMFSGGVDSSVVALRAADEAEEVHLVTVLTQSIVAPENTTQRMEFLKEKAPHVTFVHALISGEKVMSTLWDQYVLKDLLLAGLYRSYPCATCKLSMHIRALVYCKENDIRTIYDGSNVMMSFDPCQNYNGLEVLKEFYGAYGIEFAAPVYWNENVDIMLLNRFPEFRNDKVIQQNLIRGKSTSVEAQERGCGKGDMKLDVKNQYASQPLCKQSTYSTYFLHFFYFPLLGYKRLERMMIRKMRSQVSSAKVLIDKHLESGKSATFSNTVLNINERKGSCSQAEPTPAATTNSKLRLRVL